MARRCSPGKVGTSRSNNCHNKACLECRDSPPNHSAKKGHRRVQSSDLPSESTLSHLKLMYTRPRRPIRSSHTAAVGTVTDLCGSNCCWGRSATSSGTLVQLGNPTPERSFAPTRGCIRYRRPCSAARWDKAGEQGRQQQIREQRRRSWQRGFAAKRVARKHVISHWFHLRGCGKATSESMRCTAAATLLIIAAGSLDVRSTALDCGDRH